MSAEDEKVEDRIAKNVNRRFYNSGSKPQLLSGFFDEEIHLEIAGGKLSIEDAPRVRSEASRIAVKLRLEDLRRKAS